MARISVWAPSADGVEVEFFDETLPAPDAAALSPYGAALMVPAAG